MAGYPVLIAGSKALFGTQFMYAIIILQILLSLCVLAMTLNLISRITGSPLLMCASAALLVGSVGLVLDQSILTDSLFGSILALGLLLYMHPMKSAGVRESLMRAGLLGLVCCACFLIRDSMVTMILGLVPLVFIKTRMVVRKIMPAGIAIVLLTGPMLCAVELTKQWNLVRAGESIVTSVHGEVFGIVAVELQVDGYSVFSDANEIGRIAKSVYEERKGGNNGNISREIRDQLVLERGMSTQSANDAMGGLSIQAVSQFPLAYLQDVSRRLLRSLPAVFSPGLSFLSIRQLTTGRKFDGLSAVFPSFLNQPSLSGLLEVTVLMVPRILALAVVTMFFVLAAGCLVRIGAPSVEAAQLWLPWCLAGGYFFAITSMYSLIHMEPRYLSSGTPILFLSISVLVEQYRRHGTAHKSATFGRCQPHMDS